MPWWAARWPSTPAPWTPTASTWPASRWAWSSATACSPATRPGPATCKVLLEDAGLPLAEVVDDLLLPSVVYAPAIVDLLTKVDVRGVAHVTGGGIPGNLPRALPADVGYVVDPTTWEVPAIFGRIQELGGVADDEMARVFNLGIGMIVVVRPDDALLTVEALGAHGHDARVIGEVVPA